MSDTPRTDSQLLTVKDCSYVAPHPTGEYVHANFARQLERENAALRSLSTLNNNEGMLNENRLLAERDRLLRKIDVLREDKERLDWLAARGEPQTYEDAPHSLVWYVLGEDGERDFRAAIDAARIKEGQP